MEFMITCPYSMSLVGEDLAGPVEVMPWTNSRPQLAIDPVRSKLKRTVCRRNCGLMPWRCLGRPHGLLLLAPATFCQLLQALGSS